MAMVIVLLCFAAGFSFYPQLPDQIASHWNAAGAVNGYIPKFWGVFLMPIVATVMLVLFMLIPKLDPRAANIKKFQTAFDAFIVAMMLFLAYLYALTILWNLGRELSMNLLVPPALGVLFIVAGNLIGRAEPNWFIGIRTPWTLSNDAVWRKTHKVGGPLFQAAGVVSILSVVWPQHSFSVTMTAIIAAGIYSVIFSYFEYQKERRATRR